MIIKIWPIKADYANEPGKVGGVEGLKNSLDYISDSEKITAANQEIDELELLDNIQLTEDLHGFLDGNIHRVVDYMSNEDKTESKYMSGYLCNPEYAIKEFNFAKEYTLRLANKKIEKETGAVAFHIVQSFPKDLDISSEEVHQCGIELCEKINDHQGVICSHVHPLMDEKSGKLRGECKHNHILINAYIHPKKYDPQRPEKVKYNDCKASYAQLRAWNDEIAIEHGLPIIRDPDNDRSYSWYEHEAINQGRSWKQRIRTDIDGARRSSNNWDEFKEIMEAGGYIIHEGAHVAYTAPDGKHKVRGKTLGREYTKESLEMYWTISNYMRRVVEETIEENAETHLSDFMETVDGNITVGVPIGAGETVHHLPLLRGSVNIEALYTYFDDEDLYDLYDENNQMIAAVTGAELMRYLDKEQNREERRPKTLKEHQRKKKYYTNPAFRNSKTGSYYRTNLFDENGQRRSLLELIFILAMTILKKEDGLWVGNDLSSKYDNNPLYVPTAYKIQQMIDSIYLAKEQKIETPAQLDRRVQESGAALSRARSALKKTTGAKSRMEVLHNAITQYRYTIELVDRINQLPEGEEKDAMRRKYAHVIDEYKKAKTIMYRYQVKDAPDIQEFEQKYIQIQKDIRELEKRFAEEKETYRKLKMLSNSTALAQEAQYCYGPEYEPEKIEEKLRKQDSNLQIENQRTN